MSKIQGSDVKSSSDVGDVTRLISDDQLYLSYDNLDKTLLQALSDGDVGAGTGINYISNYNLNTNTTGWNLYNDGNVAIPVDGTGGVASNIAFTINTTNPLRGAGDGKIALTGALTKGQGISTDVTIDEADKNALTGFSLDYDFSDSNIGTGTFGFFLYDVTNSKVIRSFWGETVNSLKGTHTAYFYTSNSTSYRVIVHQIADTAASGDAFIDNTLFGPVQPELFQNGMISGSEIVSNPENLFTATTTNPTFGSPAVNIAVKRRVGEYLHFTWSLQMASGGNAGSGTYQFTLPDGMKIDTTKNPLNGYYGTIKGYNNSLSLGYNGWLYPINDTTFQMYIDGEYDTGSPVVGRAVWNGTFNEFTWQQQFTIELMVPIQGWTAPSIEGVAQNSLPIYATYTTNSKFVGTTQSVFSWDTKVDDTHNAYDTTTGEYTFPESGFYVAHGEIESAVIGYSTTQSISLDLQHWDGATWNVIADGNTLGNGTSSAYECRCIIGKYYNAGEKIRFRQYSDVNTAVRNGHQYNHFNIYKTNNPSDFVLPTSNSFELIESVTASNASSVSFTNISNHVYASYQIVINNVVPVTNAVSLYMRASNGGVFQTSGYTWQNWRITTTGSGVAGNGGDIGMALNAHGADNMANVASNGGSWVVDVHDCLDGGADRYIHYSGYYLGSQRLHLNGSGTTGLQSSIDGFQFLMSSGNILKGTFTLYGRRRFKG